MNRFLAICLLTWAPVLAQAEAGSGLLPLGNVGVSFPTGLEATAGVLFATVTDIAKGPSLSLRIDGFGPRWGVSAGTGWVEEIDWGGYGANLWLSQDLTHGVLDGNGVSLEGYVRILILEFRVGVRGMFGAAGRTDFAILPIAGINLGI